MSKDAKNVPALRFKGFSDAWEKRKLGRMANFAKGKGYSKADLKAEGTPIILYGSLYTNYQSLISTVSDTFVKVQPNSVFSRVGDVIVPASGETAEDISRAAAIGKNGILLGGDLNIIQPDKGKMNSHFLAITLSEGSQKKRLSRLAQGKSVVHIHNADLERLEIICPKINEQIKITNLFKGIDNLIAATQQKIDNLEQVKVALLQYLFDQSLRFSGYSIPWEKHKLGDVLGERKTRGSDLPLLSVTINNGVIRAEENGRKDNSSSDLSNYKVVRVGDIPYNSMRMWQGASGYSYFEGIVSPAYTVLVPKNQNDGLFWSYCLKRGDMLSLFTRFSQGLTSDTWNLKYPQLSAIQVKAPRKPEQVQISDMLRKIDYLITATQSKLFGYQQLKKSLLQRLFV